MAREQPSPRTGRRMHQTTLRFGPDLWEALNDEAVRAGVSVAQYVREAALARLAYSAGQRGDAGYEAALAAAGSPAVRLARETTGEPPEHTQGSPALWAQSRTSRRK